MSADEFDVIRTQFAPLAPAPEARGLLDDAAVFSGKGSWVITQDALVEGVHFLADDPLALVAQKALRVNFSDLVGKGARPEGVLISLLWPHGRAGADISHFAQGLAADLQAFDVRLWGGDLTATPGPLAISVTALGRALRGAPPARADGTEGDDLWVLGTIGDGWLGLQVRQGQSPFPHAPELEAQAVEAFQRPAVNAGFAKVIAEHAHASMDVSDGLFADAAKLAAASGLMARIEGARIPLSDAGRAFVAAKGASGLAQLANGGDDYALLFSAPPRARTAIEAAGGARIGVLEGGAGVVLIGSQGEPLPAPAGYRHRLGR